MLGCALGWLAVSVSLGVVDDSARIPPGSRARAEQTARWSADLDSAWAAAAAGRIDEAESIYRRTLESTEAAGDRGLSHARAADGLADLRRQQGRHAEAVELYERSLALWERLLGPTPQPRVAITLHNLGLCRLASGHPSEARASLERALRIWEATSGAASPEAEATRRVLATADQGAAADTGTR